MIGAGLATIGAAGSGVGIGVVFHGLIQAAAFNPYYRNVYFSYALLGFALCEAIALLALLMAFLIVFAF